MNGQLNVETTDNFSWYPLVLLNHACMVIYIYSNSLWTVHSMMRTSIWIFEYLNILINGLQILFIFVFVPFLQYKYIWIFICRLLDNGIYLNIHLSILKKLNIFEYLLRTLFNYLPIFFYEKSKSRFHLCINKYTVYHFYSKKHEWAFIKSFF